MSKPLSREKLLKFLKGQKGRYQIPIINLIEAVEEGSFDADETAFDVAELLNYIEKESKYYLGLSKTNSTNPHLASRQEGMCAGLNKLSDFIKSKLKKETEVKEEEEKKCCHCNNVLTSEEIHYYENSCNKCEAKFSDDMSKERTSPCDFFERKLKQENKNLIDADELTTWLQNLKYPDSIGGTIETNSEYSFVKFPSGQKELIDSIINFIKSKLPAKEDELAPCPAGHKALIDKRAPSFYWVGCGEPQCWLLNKFYKTEAESRAAWNARANG